MVMQHRGRNVPRKLSPQAEGLLGYLVTLADAEGFVELTRGKLAAARSVSVPTISRALRELRDAGQLVLVKPGGGRGHPSRYRITRLSGEQLHAPSTRAEVPGWGMPERWSQMGKIGAELDHDDPDRELDLSLEATWALAADLGRTAVAGAAGWLQGAAEAWRRLPTWQRALLCGFPLGTIGALLGRRHGGNLGTAIGGGVGLLAGTVLALLIPPEEKSPETPVETPALTKTTELSPDQWLIGHLARQMWEN